VECEVLPKKEKIFFTAKDSYAFLFQNPLELRKQMEALSTEKL